MDRLRVTIAPAKRSIYIHSTRQRIRLLSKEGEPVPILPSHQPLRQIGAAAYSLYLRASKENNTIVFAALLVDI